MIPDLLWRCPLCAANDALTHRQRWLCPEVVSCTACGARWRVRRVVGDNFYLKITQPSAVNDAYRPGFELSITAWYDVMKQMARMEPLRDPQVPLENAEVLYLASGPAELWADSDEALPHSDRAGSPVGAPPPHEAQGCCAGTGRVFLTSRRIIWQGDKQALNIPLRQVNGVYAILNMALAVVVGVRLYYLRFDRESPLKWLTYAAWLAKQMRIESGHTIRTSHY